LLIFGGIIPKSVMQQTADATAPIVIYPLRWFRFVAYPLIAVFARVARLVAPLAGAGAANSKLFMTREQLSAVVEITEKSSQLAAFDQGRIRQVIRVAQATVGEAMIPMAEVYRQDPCRRRQPPSRLSREREQRDRHRGA
jgi:putative hemolysin